MSRFSPNEMTTPTPPASPAFFFYISNFQLGIIHNFQFLVVRAQKCFLNYSNRVNATQKSQPFQSNRAKAIDYLTYACSEH